MVTMRAGLPDETIDPDEVMAHLAAISGKLRCDVAAVITRKRAPKLLFQILLTTQRLGGTPLSPSEGRDFPL